MRPRDPRRLLPANRTHAVAGVRILDEPESRSQPGGPVQTRQSAKLTLPRPELDRLWTPEYLERLARTYWAYLSKISLGLLRVVYGEDSREIVFLTRPFVLLRFRSPEYELSPQHGSVTWRIERGLLVNPRGRGSGYLRITVDRDPDEAGEEVGVRVSSEVAHFYPTIGGSGWFSRIGSVLYRVTQLQLHVLITHAFFRSLARLELEESAIGALRPRQAEHGDGGNPRRVPGTRAPDGAARRRPG